MKRILISISLALLILLSPVSAQVFNSRRLDSLFSLLSEKNKAMGSLAVMKEGKVIYTKAIGYSSISPTGKTAATPLTRYRTGSISKMFTAVMIFQLSEEKKITLNTPLSKWYPQIPNAEKITIGQMLNHHSGIHSFTSDPEYLSWMTTPKKEKEILEYICAKPAEFLSGEKGAYSNSNYYLLGRIIEKITGKPYTENLKKRITGKIGLKNTYYGGKTDLLLNESFSYKMEDQWIPEPETDMSIPHGAGAVVSTPSDLVLFIDALFAGKLVKPESLSQMQTILDGYGMGIFEVPFYERKAFGHGGAIDGFRSDLRYFPDDKLAVAYCSNGQAYPLNDILNGVLSICFNREYKLPSLETLTVDPEKLDLYVGVYSSTQLPLKITISRKEKILMGQGTGQPAFPMEATAVDTFVFLPAKLKMVFRPEKKEMTLYQGGGKFEFTKEK